MTNRNETLVRGVVDLTSDKTLKKQLLRNNEYYDLQETFDCLYEKSIKNHKFKDLMSLISHENNILLAYRNIKNNKGSKTKGTDGKTIKHYQDYTEEKFISYFQNKVSEYKPKSVRRVEIPKPNGKLRPLGIPCMSDRILQQCVKQVLEPICEAKFHKHSYGFRPNRSTSHAIARANYLMWKSQLHYAVDIDIKGFFDNVNHGKLIKQMWTLGIEDKKLLCLIGKILKSEIKGIGIPERGTPQGGIISPLLSNIVLNELDWWLSNQWESFDTRHKYSSCSHKYRALKTTSLKEIYFVRYADDFKIFCRDYKTAQKIFVATKQWLEERLGLEVSPEKSKITNVRKKATEFLGFSLKVKLKRKRYVTQSNICEKAKKTIKAKLKEQIKAIQKNTVPKEVNRLNATILGIHNYYRIATNVNIDFSKINFIVNKSLNNRLKAKLKIKRKNSVRNKDSPYLSKTYLKLYGKYNGKIKIVVGIIIFPIYGVTHESAMNFTQEINSYTNQGRSIIHKNVNNVTKLIKYLLIQKDYKKSTEYNDNRISLLSAQNGKCYVTGLVLKIDEMECHHKKPRSQGGTDEYKNLVLVNKYVHKLIHSTQIESIDKYLNKLRLDTKAFEKLNSLRLSVGNLEIVNVA